MLERDMTAEETAPAPQPDAPEPDDALRMQTVDERTVTDDGEILDKPEPQQTDILTATDAQLNRLGVLVRDLDMERDDLVTNWLKPLYQVESRKDLSRDQASNLISHLQAAVFVQDIESATTLERLNEIAVDIRKAGLKDKPRDTVAHAYKRRKTAIELGEIEPPADAPSAADDPELDEIPWDDEAAQAVGKEG
jgi:hypothetical protein